MTDQMKISIIVPVYNVERYIEECLKSVMEQNFGGALECIVAVSYTHLTLPTKRIV